MTGLRILSFWLLLLHLFSFCPFYPRSFLNRSNWSLLVAGPPFSSFWLSVFPLPGFRHLWSLLQGHRRFDLFRLQQVLIHQLLAIFCFFSIFSMYFPQFFNHFIHFLWFPKASLPDFQLLIPQAPQLSLLLLQAQVPFLLLFSALNRRFYPITSSSNHFQK